MKLTTGLFGTFCLLGWLACSNASTDCDKLGTCNAPPTGSGGSTTGPTTGPTTSGTGGTAGQGGSPPAGCTDGVQNGDESDVDCGGSCPPCANGQSCSTPADCESNHCNAQDTCAPCTQGSCQAGTFCDAGVCAPLRPLGEGCATDAECESDHCIDDVCCADTCEGACRRCDFAGTEGTCTFAMAGTDPDDECDSPPISVCDVGGVCE